MGWAEKIGGDVQMSMSIRQERFLWSRIKDYEKRISKLEKLLELLTGQDVATALASEQTGPADTDLPTDRGKGMKIFDLGQY
jgi:hypothetical protein